MKINKKVIISVLLFSIFCGAVIAQNYYRWQNFSIPPTALRVHQWDTENFSIRDGCWIVVTSPDGMNLLKVYEKTQKGWVPLASDRKGRKWNSMAGMVKVVNENNFQVNYKAYPVSKILQNVF